MDNNLVGKILIATPSMEDPCFEHSIILICQHDSQSALGIMLNRTIKDMNLQKLLDDLGIANNIIMNNSPVLDGGPCQPERGFVIHSSDWQEENTKNIAKNLNLSVSKEILNAIAYGANPQKFIIALGYAGWGAGQLEEEISANSWLIIDANEDMIYDLEHLKSKWLLCLSHLGVDPKRFSPYAGRA